MSAEQKPQPGYDQDFAKLIQWLKKEGLTGHTPIRGPALILRKKKVRKPWPTGSPSSS